MNIFKNKKSLWIIIGIIVIIIHIYSAYEDKESHNSELATVNRSTSYSWVTVATKRASSAATTRATTTVKKELPVSYIVYITKTGEKYHRSGCQYLRQSKIAIEKNAAISSGYSACSVCKP